jgi:hypothetical protein
VRFAKRRIVTATPSGDLAVATLSGRANGASAPPKAGRDVLEDRLDDVGVVVNAELIGHGQEQRVGLGDGFVLLELRDENVRLGGVAAAENGARVCVEKTDLVPLLAAAAERPSVLARRLQSCALNLRSWTSRFSSGFFRRWRPAETTRPAPTS